jgi:peptidyl-prolyl cis-trans isomerase A (cyclophilin A)
MFSTIAIAAAKKSDTKTNHSKKEKAMIAVFDTSMGTFKAKLNPEEAPKTVENFVGLAEGKKEWTDPKSGKKEKKPFYNGLTFHRIVAGFMIQGGDPLGNGTGGPGYTIPDEYNAKMIYDKPGILAMARTQQPNSAGSQFFVTVGAAPWLNGQYTRFGEVIEGMDVVTKISKVHVTGDVPAEKVTIKSIKIEHK